MTQPFGDLPILETERLILRTLTKEDAEALYRYTSNDNVSRYVSWNTHQSIADTEKYIEYSLEQYKKKEVAPWAIVYKDNGMVIGTIDFMWWSEQNQSAEIGYALSEDYWGKGLVPEAGKRVLEYGFTEKKLVRIQAKCVEENTASARVMEKIGMTYEGTMRKEWFRHGKHWNIKIYSILVEEWTN